jgi:methoxymalonate biosynthesis acyl carrier protein
VTDVVHTEAAESRSDVSKLVDHLRQLFSTEFKVDVPSADTDLLETGLLDSLGLVDLLLHLEQEFRVQISFDALEVEDFRSLTTIATIVAERQSSR